jgi:2-polyprenyl-6-methoxyphenol hydroxylase-like FAD-dependent oxidoreductase
MNSQTDVLVVGAGPTGLTTAIELARRSIGVRIVEKRTEPSTTSKALVVHARTLEQLDTIELADELVAKGYTSPGIDFSASADHPLRADMHKLAGETRYPFILILPQADTEAALERRLERENVRVERGTTLKSFAERGEGIEATVGRNGATETIEARYIVGADGPHSVVRETLGIRFEGSPYGWTAFLGDVTMRGHEAEGGTEQHSSNRGLAFIVPFEDGTHRIVTIDQNYQGGPKRSDLELSELQESISAILGKPVELSDPKWLSRWGADLKLAEAYGRGRAFLAGDAAHTHSPAGGQGMNTGIQDAFGLGWRLALAVRGRAGAGLLQSWRDERHAQGERVLRTSDLLLRSLLLHQPLARHARESLFQVLIPLPPVQHTLAMNLSGLGVHYGRGERWAGARMPDLVLANAEHRPVRVYERLRSGHGLLLVYVDPKAAGQERGSLQAVVDRAAGYRLDSAVVLRNGVPARHLFAGATTLVDYRGDFEVKLGGDHPRVLVVRPDGYIAIDLPALDAEAFGEACARLLETGQMTARAPDEGRVLAGPARGRAAALAGIFALSGTLKLACAEPMRAMFDGYHLPRWLMSVVGVWELAGAAAVARRSERAAGAAAIAALTVGAAATHAKAREPLKMLNALALLALAGSVLAATKRRP